jgi:ABC-type dipeptide/oligopeptide/nickel transport system ATPase subunit
MDAGQTVLSASGLRKDYRKGVALVHAVIDVSLEMTPGESVAIVGPSGCPQQRVLQRHRQRRQVDRVVVAGHPGQATSTRPLRRPCGWPRSSRGR